MWATPYQVDFWLGYQGGYHGESESVRYLVAFYWTVVTMYGDRAASVNSATLVSTALCWSDGEMG